MGAQKSTELEELSIVVDISRDNNIASGTSPASIVKKTMPVTGSKESNHSISSSGISAESSEGTEAVVDAVNHENDEVMQEAVVEDASGDLKVSGPQVDQKKGSEASQRDVVVLHNSPVLNGLAHDKDGVSKPKANRKRKKTVHYMNSRVPHSVPVLESDDGSDSPGSPEEAEEMPVRQAPRAAASKLKAMVPVGDKMPKPPRNAKELMATGLLTGHHVRCSCRGEQLTGTLQDMGVVCDCRNCKGEQVVSISAFEAHSGSTSHHPSDNIYLENGKNLRDILSAGQEAADCGDNIFRALKHAIGEIQGIVKRTVVCGKCGSCEGGNLMSCKGARCSVVYHPECIGIPGSHQGDWFCAKCEKIMKKPHANLKVKRSGPSGGEREVPRSREKDLTVLARSARDAHVHKALFLPGGLADGTELGYYARNQCILMGVKRGGGICCSCCDKEMSCSAFELHAGCEARRNPYGSILLADGRSLKDVCKELADQNKLGARAKHVSRAGEINSCVECGENGDQKLCHSCGLSWCHDCAEETFDLGAEKQSDKWYCRICKKDNMALKSGGRTVNGGTTIIADDRNRRVRHFQAPDPVGGCAICKKWNLSKSGFDGMTMLVCDQCGREYHVGCLKKAGMVDVNELPEGEWFCQKDCQDIDEILKQLVANGPESLSDSIISELLESRQQQGAAKEKAESSSPSFGWQILCGRSGNAVNGQTLAEAVDIFTECSDPIKDATTGRNLIPLMVHSRRLKDYDFEGVFCVVLKLNEKVVSAALLQIFGRKIAEVPLIATSLAHQGQGFCKALMTTIERLLGVLSVEYLVLPTAKDAESIWVNKFGFGRMDDEQLAKIRMTIRLMTFTGTCMLEKAITPMPLL